MKNLPVTFHQENIKLDQAEDIFGIEAPKLHGGINQRDKNQNMEEFSKRKV